MPVPRFPRFPRWTWAHRLTALGFLVFLALGSELWFPWLRGSLSSTRLFGVVPFADPLSALEQMLAARSVAAELLLGLGVTALLYLILGRVFCGWLCPFGLMLELLHALRERVDRRLYRRFRWHLPRLRAPTWPKYWLLLFFLSVSFFSALPVFGIVSPIQWSIWAVTFRGDFAWGAVFVSVLLAIAVLELLVPRVFCRSLCPIGGVYALLGRFALLRIRISPEESGRKLCKQCSIHCPMGIDVMQAHVLEGHRSVEDPECTRCGTCLDVCRGDGILSLGFQVARSSANAPKLVLPEECSSCDGEAPRF
jgi:ferredoxin-type protein NapH